MKIDFLIVGQGIAGTILSFTLRQAGYKVKVIDNRHKNSASTVAAGIFNPITGRKLVKTWFGDALFEALHQFYPEFENYLTTHFFHRREVYVPFDSQEKQNTWLAQAAEPAYAPFVKGFARDLYKDSVPTPFGGMLIDKAGYVDIPAMLLAYQRNLIEHKLLIEEGLDYSDIELVSDGVKWKNVESKMLIFCDGAGSATENPYFNWLAFKQVKGELFTVRFPNQNFTHLVNRGCWILPVQGGLYKVGATYNNQDLTKNITEDAKVQLEEKLKALTTAKYEIVEQKAGIRPATYDRRPFLGVHPIYNQIAIFNGLGAKGISLAPYFAQHFVDVLTKGKKLMGLVTIDRVIRKYQVKNEVLAKL